MKIEKLALLGPLFSLFALLAALISALLMGLENFGLFTPASPDMLTRAIQITGAVFVLGLASYAIVLPDPGEPLEPNLADFIIFPSEVQAPEDAKLGVMLDSSDGLLTVAGFSRGSGAEKAGIKKGDSVLAVDGLKVKDFDDLRILLATKHVGDVVRVKVRRDKATVELDVELGAPSRHEP